MSEITLTPATVLLLILVAAWLGWAIYRLSHRGLCDCHGKRSKDSKDKGAHGCEHCGSGECSACAESLKSVQKLDRIHSISQGDPPERSAQSKAS